MNLSAFQQWVGLLAAVMHLILGSLTADGGASLLSRYTDWRVPAKALPISLLVVTIASGVVDGLVNGVGVQQAFVTSALTLIASLTGATAHHALVSSGTARSVIVFVGAAFLCLKMLACTPALERAIATVVHDASGCLIDHQDLSDPAAFAKCEIEKLDEPRAAEVLKKSRLQSAKHAAASLERVGHAYGCGAEGGAP